jgi:hypothetical protein
MGLVCPTLGRFVPTWDTFVPHWDYMPLPCGGRLAGCSFAQHSVDDSVYWRVRLPPPSTHLVLTSHIGDYCPNWGDCLHPVPIWYLLPNLPTMGTCPNVDDQYYPVDRLELGHPPAYTGGWI